MIKAERRSREEMFYEFDKKAGNRQTKKSITRDLITENNIESDKVVLTHSKGMSASEYADMLDEMDY
jgi:hypothetical protein